MNDTQQVLTRALQRLSFAAQTTGGTGGQDYVLQAAIGQAEEALRYAASVPVGDPVDKFRGMPCEVRDDNPVSKSHGMWIEAKFIALDQCGYEPIVQINKRMPWFATWAGVRGLPRGEIESYYQRIDKAKGSSNGPES